MTEATEGEQRPHDEARECDPEYDETADSVVHRRVSSQRGRYSQRDTQEHAQRNGRGPEGQAQRQPLGNQVTDTEIPELEGRPEIPVRQAPQVVPVLDPEGLVQAVQPVEIGPDRRREGLLLVERATGR